MSEYDLTIPGGKLRLHVEVPLGAGLHVKPDDQQAHYLIHVMRAKPGDRIRLFNGRDGEWSARIAEVTKHACSLECDR
ncbi:MAG: RNA methyltransferase PUA domain-containing protein, partial [Rhizomicrobium sp.]